MIHSYVRADNLRAETRTASHLREVFQVSEGVTPAPKRLRKETMEEIIFTDRDLEGVQLPHSDALVVTMQIGDFEVKRILIDPGSSAEIIYDSLFKGLGLEHKDLDGKVDPLYGFSRESVMPVGRVTVKVQVGNISSLIGMATGRIGTGSWVTRTRPAHVLPIPDPALPRWSGQLIPPRSRTAPPRPENWVIVH